MWGSPWGLCCCEPLLNTQTLRELDTRSAALTIRALSGEGLRRSIPTSKTAPQTGHAERRYGSSSQSSGSGLATSFIPTGHWACMGMHRLPLHCKLHNLFNLSRMRCLPHACPMPADQPDPGQAPETNSQHCGHCSGFHHGLRVKRSETKSQKACKLLQCLLFTREITNKAPFSAATSQPR